MFAAFDTAVEPHDPDVSVVVPTYNRAALLGESLASVLAQEGVTLECWSSTMARPTTRARSSGRWPTPASAIFRAHMRHRGGPECRDRGGCGAYVAFHDSDDVALPGRLAVPVEFLRAHPDVHLVIQNGRMLAPETSPGPRGAWIAPRVARTLTARPLGVAEVFRWNLGQLQGMCFTRGARDDVRSTELPHPRRSRPRAALTVGSRRSSSTCRPSPTAATVRRRARP